MVWPDACSGYCLCCRTTVTMCLFQSQLLTFMSQATAAMLEEKIKKFPVRKVEKTLYQSLVSGGLHTDLQTVRKQLTVC